MSMVFLLIALYIGFTAPMFNSFDAWLTYQFICVVLPLLFVLGIYILIKFVLPLILVGAVALLEGKV